MIDASPVTLATLAGLLTASGFFSSSETALFSLTPRQLDGAGPAVRRLLAQPRDLLATVLLGNLVVNLLFFSAVTRLVTEDERSALLVGFIALVAILVFGEILPKTIGLKAAPRVAGLTAPALLAVATVTLPVRVVMRLVLEPLMRLLGEHARQEPRLTPADLERLLARRAAGGHMLHAEADLLAEIVELESIDVRQIMTPRVDALFVQQDGSNLDEVLGAAAAARISRLPVVDGDPDHVIGGVRVRDLLAHPERPVAQAVMPVAFVPEVASSLDLLHTLRHLRAAEAVVVDEWGGTAGVVTLEDIFEELVGDLRVEGEEREVGVVPLGEGRFRVAGSLSMHDWNDAFGHDVVPNDFDTVGGFVMALLGRVPRVGDRASWRALEMQVHEVRGRRVHWVDMWVRPLGADGGREPGEGGARPLHGRDR